MRRRLLIYSLLTLLLQSCWLIEKPDLPALSFDGPDLPALNFDGIDDSVVIAELDENMDNISNGLTVESWIYLNSYPNSYPRILDRSDATLLPPLGDTFILAVSEQYSAAQININGYSIYSEPIELRKWTHIAGTFDGETLKIYVNGELQGMREVDTTIDVKESSLHIGSNASGLDRQFHGYIDEIRVWNIPRTNHQINEKMNKQLSGSERGLIAYWPLNEGQGFLIEDRAGDNEGVLGSGIAEQSPAWLTAAFPH